MRTLVTKKVMGCVCAAFCCAGCFASAGYEPRNVVTVKTETTWRCLVIRVPSDYFEKAKWQIKIIPNSRPSRNAWDCSGVSIDEISPLGNLNRKSYRRRGLSRRFALTFIH